VAIESWPDQALSEMRGQLQIMPTCLTSASLQHDSAAQIEADDSANATGADNVGFAAAIQLNWSSALSREATLAYLLESP